MDLIPKIKKTVCSFLTSEEGRISKQSLLVLGTLMGTAAIASLSSKIVHAQCPSCGGGCAAPGCASPGCSSPGCGCGAAD